MSRITATVELLINPKRWTKGPFARDADGKTCDPRSDQAVSWCLVGALLRCYPSSEDPVAFYRAVDKVIAKLPKGRFPAEWNDDPARTHAEVLEAVIESGV